MALYKLRLDSQLKQYATDLERRNRELDTFASNVANNLHSLAEKVSTHADLLNEKLRLSDDLYQNMEVIARSGRKMSQVIDDLLLLARIRQTQVELKPVHMARIVAEAQQRLSQLTPLHRAEIQFPDTGRK